MTTLSVRRPGSMLEGAFWMVLLSLLLAWLPGVGHFIAGVVGGYRSGGLGNAIVASLVPALLAGLLLLAVLTFIPVPMVNVLAGAAVFVVVAISGLAVTAGAIVGALLR